MLAASHNTAAHADNQINFGKRIVLTGLFMVVMGYVEVFGTRHYGTPLSALSAPLNTLADIYNVPVFKHRSRYAPWSASSR